MQIPQVFYMHFNPELDYWIKDSSSHNTLN